MNRRPHEPADYRRALNRDTLHGAPFIDGKLLSSRGMKAPAGTRIPAPALRRQRIGSLSRDRLLTIQPSGTN